MNPDLSPFPGPFSFTTEDPLFAPEIYAPAGGIQTEVSGELQGESGGILGE